LVCKVCCHLGIDLEWDECFFLSRYFYDEALRHARFWLKCFECPVGQSWTVWAK
jgi:hypothetical protein